ncbi:DUF378 domain-containing protein [Pseudogracilibacillus sp. SE30717A]|uniref:DUF378 domain-containing protein n=1 Tax=Pseudogracilibacillus sp. SE30717A TaxID=3098293 RepID=UPI00300E34E8
MQTLRGIAWTLVIIGAINWGLIGLFQFDLVAAIFGGQDSGLSRIIYSLVGISGLITIGLLFTKADDRDGGAVRRDPSFGTEFGEDSDIDRDL